MTRKTTTFTRKRRFRPVLIYSALDLLAASAVNPAPEHRRQYQIGNMRRGLEALERGEHPAPDDWRLCSDVVNMMETFVAMGQIKLASGDVVAVEDPQGLIADAVNALAAAAKRHYQGKTIRLDGPGLVAVRAALRDYAELLDVLPERVVMDCHRRTETRLQEISMGKRKPHDVEVISI